MTNKLIKLESLRGFAALYVVLYHLFGSGLILFGLNFTFLFKFGQEAVILFFILSGFVINYSFEKSKDKSFKLYFSKRFFRIFIPLIIVFITNYLLLSLNNKDWVTVDWKNLIGNLFMLQDISISKPAVLFDSFLDNLPLWSLSYEWWFYILFFIFFKIFKKDISLKVYIITIFAAITYLIVPNFINREVMYLSIWWMGGDISRLYAKKKEINFTNLKFPIITIFIITIILLFNIYIQNKLDLSKLSGLFCFHPWAEFRHFFTTLIIISVALIWKKLKWFGFDYTFGFFKIFAPISFVLYISHYFLIISAKYLNPFIENFILRTITYFIICIIFSYVVEMIIYVKLNKLIMNKLFPK